MKLNLLLAAILAVTLGTTLFAGTAFVRLVTRENVVIGSWGEGRSLDLSGIFASDAGQANPGVLGTFSTADPEPAPAQVSAQFTSFQGYLFDEYLEAQNSPLAGHGEDFVQACADYETPKDCTLLIAISRIETGYCTTDISAQQFNCWGFGGSGPNRILYSSFEESIDEITRRLMEGYGTRFFENPNNGALFYCGRHCVKWGDYVLEEQIRLKNYLRDNGFNWE